MGKNGSASVYQTLKNRFPHLNIFHVHFLSDSGLKEAEEFTKRKGQTLEANKIKTVIDQNPNKVLRIITLVREPMARDVSDLFHNLSIYMKEFGMKEFDIDELIKNFLNKFDYEYTLEWFDKELRNFLDIDVFEIPFPHDVKYKILKKGRIEVLTMRTEDLSNVFCDAMKEFTGVHFKKLINSNVARNKEYAQLYFSFIEALPVTPKSLDERYNTKYTYHFYTDEEIDRFRKKWLSKK
jgi:hypothetical protein